jgi:dolichol-phosphate mannosyltransferase
MRTLVVTPTYIEALNVIELLERLRAAVPDVDILVVDDNSPDGTADLAEQTGKDLGRVDVLRRPRKIGLGDAYRAGFAVGVDRGYDAIVQMDADLSHDPDALPGLLEACDNGADLVVGSRYVPGGSIPHWPWFRRALSKWGNRYATFVLGMPINDATSGYRVYRAGTLKAIDFATTRAKGYGFQIELAYRVWRWGGRIEQLPIVFTDRVRGQSKMTLGVAVEELSLVTWWGIRDRLMRRDPRG